MLEIVQFVCVLHLLAVDVADWHDAIGSAKTDEEASF